MSPARSRDFTPLPAARPASIGFSRLGRSLVLTALAFLSLRNAPGCECPALTGAESSAKLPTPACADHATALQTYAARAAALRQHALRTGTITYQEVVDAAYAPGTIDPGLLEMKAGWRATQGRDFVFITDYATLRDGAAVQPLVAVADPSLQSTLVAQYESTSHLIGIAPVATDFAIFHETGHALQRATLRARGGAAGRRTEAPPFPLASTLFPDAADATTLRRLQYLCSQDEFEVRLQDLNRFHALLVGGRPILNATDSVRALAALGVPLTYEETRDAFAFDGLTLSPETFGQLTSITPVDAGAVAVAFEDARELYLVRKFTLRVNAACWPRLLAKIIFEAPGHL